MPFLVEEPGLSPVIGSWYAERVEHVRSELAQATPGFRIIAKFALSASLALSTVVVGHQISPHGAESIEPVAAAQAEGAQADSLQPQLADLGVQFKNAPTAEKQPTVSSEALNLIKQFEGWSSQLYNDATGHATIGYGHLVDDSELEAFQQGITPEQGEQLLSQDLANAESAIERLVTVPLTENQRRALCSFIFNVGVGTFRNSTLLDYLNHGNYAAVPGQLVRFIYSDGEQLPGLQRRREAEVGMWNNG